MDCLICKSKHTGQPAFDKPLNELLAKIEIGDELRRITAAESITDRQRRWYRGVCLPELARNGDTVDEWDLRLKASCNGNELLKKEQIYLGNGVSVTRLSISGVGKKNMTAFIENVLSECLRQDWPVLPPDAELRKP